MRKGGVKSVHTVKFHWLRNSSLSLFSPSRQTFFFFSPSLLVRCKWTEPRRLTFVPSWDCEVQEHTRLCSQYRSCLRTAWFSVGSAGSSCPALDLPCWEMVGGLGDRCALSVVFDWTASICFFLEDNKGPWKGLSSLDPRKSQWYVTGIIGLFSIFRQDFRCLRIVITVDTKRVLCCLLCNGLVM